MSGKFRQIMDFLYFSFSTLGSLDANKKDENWGDIFGKSPDPEHWESSNYEFESSKNIMIGNHLY